MSGSLGLGRGVESDYQGIWGFLGWWQCSQIDQGDGCRRCKKRRLDPQVGKIHWRRAQQPTPVFLPGGLHEHKGLVGSSPRGHMESDTTDWAAEHTRLHNPMNVLKTKIHITGVNGFGTWIKSQQIHQKEKHGAESLPFTDFIAFIDTHCLVLHVAFGPLQLPTPVLKCVKHYGVFLGVRS